MSESIQITAPEEIAAVKSGELPGDCYRDGDVYAEVIPLIIWRSDRQKQASAS